MQLHYLSGLRANLLSCVSETCDAVVICVLEMMQFCCDAVVFHCKTWKIKSGVAMQASNRCDVNSASHQFVAMFAL